jgi:hypothetical protein
MMALYLEIMNRIENLYEITKKLTGIIEPAGDASRDGERLINLEDTILLTERLIEDIIYAARNKVAYESSVKVCGMRADRFISELRERLVE